jgi:hypothetical protein
MSGIVCRECGHDCGETNNFIAVYMDIYEAGFPSNDNFKKSEDLQFCSVECLNSFMGKIEIPQTVLQKRMKG